MIIVNRLDQLDGVEVRPGVNLIGNPAFHKESGKWRCLADVLGCLCIVELKVTVVGDSA